MAFAPDDRPRLSVAVGGELAAVAEPARITVIELAGLHAVAEVAVDAEAAATEVGWLGQRLLVLRRYAGHATAQLYDPRAPALVSELWLGARLRLAAVTGEHALVAGPLGTAVIGVEADRLAAREWPSAVVPDAAGGAGRWFAVAAGDAIEAWDPVQLVVVRRLVVAPDEPIFAGGTAAAAWRVTQAAPSVVEVIPWGDGETERHDTGAPIAQLAAHPDSAWLACLDAAGRVHAIGRGAIATPGLDRAEAIALAIGARAALLVARGRAPLAVIELGEPRPVAGDGSGPRTRVVEPAVGEPARGADEPGWRDAAAGWARAVAAGQIERSRPATPPIEALIAQLGVRAELAPVVVLLYGAHLGGSDGAALADLARLLGGWTELLGGGELVERGLATIRDSRMQLGSALRRRLDELP